MDSSTTPLVSVIMPAYNAERYLRTAVESILQQTFTDFEFIILNDGSTDQTENILRTYKDPRIQIISQKQSGLVPSLNRLLDAAKGKLIARMDADDESEPTRFNEQTSWFQENLDGILVGSWVNIIDSDCKTISRAIYPTTNGVIQLALATGNKFTHGAVMFRKCNLRYRTEYNFAEDYDLWRRLAVKGKIGNIPKFLYSWRNHSTSISNTQTNKQNLVAKKISREHCYLLSKKVNELPDTQEILFETKFSGRMRVALIFLRSAFALLLFKPQFAIRIYWKTLKILVTRY